MACRRSQIQTWKYCSLKPQRVAACLCRQYSLGQYKAASCVPVKETSFRPPKEPVALAHQGNFSSGKVRMERKFPPPNVCIAKKNFASPGLEGRMLPFRACLTTLGLESFTKRRLQTPQVIHRLKRGGRNCNTPRISLQALNCTITNLSQALVHLLCSMMPCTSLKAKYGTWYLS